ncbi:MAG: histidine ammonia-lyase [Flavobacteriales bacterium]|jgi:histidine ammonia-lyase
MSEVVEICIDDLSIENINFIIQSNAKIALSVESAAAVQKCRSYLDKKMSSGDDIFYGVNTGFGSLCNTKISNADLSQLQENLVKSHACGMGDEIPNEIVKLMLLLKVQGLSYGHSGIAPQTINRLIDFYNHDIIPIVFEEGSLGASGDLAPLAHMSLPLLGLGYVDYQGERRKSSEVLSELGWEPITLQSKEGLALLNGTQFMSAHGVIALIKSQRLLKLANIIGAISLEAYDGRANPFNDNVHQVRKQEGQIAVAAAMREILKGSELIQQHKVNVQDPYSFRCIPQVHGASLDTFNHVKSVVEREINAVTDNPTIFPDTDEIVSAGNFHGQPLALTSDYLAIAMAEIGSISERRTYKLVSGTRDLPSYLAASSGLNSGFMIAQYSAASIVSKSKQFCTPSSIDSIDSSQGQEDHVSMGANGVVKLMKVVENTEKILAIELLSACQALDFRGADKTSPQLKSFYDKFRKSVSFIEEDVVMHNEMSKALAFVQEVELD